MAQADDLGHQLVRQTVEKFIPPGQIGWNPQPEFKEAVGCDACLHTGYLGRVAVYELFDVDDRIRQQITDQDSEAEIIEQIRALGVRSMAHDGYIKVWQGITTVAEVMTVGA